MSKPSEKPYGWCLVLRHSDGRVLGSRGGRGWDLPHGEAPDGTSAKEAAMAARTGLEVAGLSPVYRGPGSGYGMASAYAGSWEGEPDEEGFAWVGVPDVLAGEHGLYARDVLNKIGVIRRPRLDLESVYRISSRVLGEPSHRTRGNIALEAIDLVLDEVSFLVDAGQLQAVNDLLREIDVPKVHADVLDAIMAVTDGLEGLPDKERFDADAKAVIEAVDALIPKWKLKTCAGEVISEDVRGDARKIYRAKAERFKQVLREKGSLDEFYRSKGGKSN